MKHFIFRNLLIISSIAIVFLYIKCDDDDDDSLVVEGGYEITGVVLDSALQQPMHGVSVGFLNGNIPDSVILVGDSVNIDRVNLCRVTDNLGKFFMQFIGSYDSTRMQLMFAWKKEYNLWRFIHTPVPVNEIEENSYELTIYLSKK